jgi:DNA-binding transcriptional LysR family regulator
VKQSAVSRRVQALEDELGVSLFERSPSGVRPTIAGERFFERVRAGLWEINQAVENAAAAGRGEQGLLRIGVLPSFFPSFLADLLIEYRANQPEVTVELFDGSPRELAARMMARRLDVSFVADGIPTPGCDAEPVSRGRLRIALASHHPLAGCELIDWGLLKGEHFVFGRQAAVTELARHVRQALARLDGQTSIGVFDVSEDLLMRLVGMGFGVSLVNEHSSAIPYPGVSFRGLAGEEGRICCRAAWLPGNDNPALRRFLSLIREKARPGRHGSYPEASD